MKSPFISMCLCLLLVATGLLHAGLAQEKPIPTKERIGVYDSRAVAVAYAGSSIFEKEMQETMARYNQARETGDARMAAKLEAEGKARQETLHKQGFGTAPVCDILVHITETLSEIERATGVTVVVSKWDKAGLARHAGAEQVDVTLRLVDALHPNDRQRNRALEIQRHPPIALEQAATIKD